MSQATTRLDNLLRTPFNVILTGATVAFIACASPSFAEPARELPAQQRTISASAAAKQQRLFDRAEAYIAAGEPFEAERIYRNILRDHPGQERAYQALRDLAASRELSAISSASKAAQQRLPAQFAIHQTSRFVLFSDVAAELTQQNALWVERAHEEFDRFVADCGLRPLPLQHKLVCILFDRRADFMDFAQTQDGLANPAFTGYYSPRNDRVVFSIDADRQAPVSRRERGSAGPASGSPAASADSTAAKPVLGFDARGVESPEAHQHHDHDAACDHDSQVPSQAAAKCVHEIIHQLMFHTRVMAPEVQYPLWVCEGLSTAFETDRPNRPFGPDHDYAPRREAFENLLRDDNLLPLRELVVITNLNGAHAHATRSVYQQSYALVTWMCRERKQQLREYLNIMRYEPAGRLSAARHLHLFESAFGKIEQVETDWLEYERDGRRAN